MKTVLTTVRDSYFIRSFMRSDACSTLLTHGDVRLVLLVDPKKIPYYTKEFPNPMIIFTPFPSGAGGILKKNYLERFFKYIEVASIHTKTVSIIARSELCRKHNTSYIFRFPLFLIGRILWHMGRFRAYREFIRFLYRIIPTNTFGAVFDKWKPDIVFCPALIYDEHRLVKEARARRIPTVACVLSWDNFYSKAMLRVKPDLLIVQTTGIKNQAIRFGDFLSEKIVVTGIPQYDRYFKKIGIMSRADFIRSLGGDPEKKLIVYGFSGKSGIAKDLENIKYLADISRVGGLAFRVNILLRPYPRHDKSISSLQTFLDRGVLVKSAMTHIEIGVGQGVSDWEFDENALDLLTNTLAHADVIVSMYSTFFVEGAIFDKPLVAVAFDRAKVSSDESASRYFKWDHLEDVRRHEGIGIAKSEEEFISYINEGLLHPEIRKVGRQNIVLDQIEYTDGRSAERLGQALLEFLLKQKSHI